MTPTNQTKFSAFTSKGERITYGNCLVACIASVLDVDIHEVPNVYTLYGITRPQHPDEKPTPYWAEVLNTWMREKHGKQLEIIPALAYASRVAKDPNYPRTCIVKGMSHRDKPHFCIYHLSTLIWDPHPAREGLKEMKDVYVITPVRDAELSEPEIKGILRQVYGFADIPELAAVKKKLSQSVAKDLAKTAIDTMKTCLVVEEMVNEATKPDYWKLVEERRERLSNEIHNPLESHSIY